MASAIVNPLLAAEPFEEAVDGPRSPTSDVEMQLYYEEQERQDTQRRLSRRDSRTKSWRRSLVGRAGSSKNVNAPTHHKTVSEADSDAYGTVHEGSSNPPSPSAYGDPAPLRSPPTHPAPIPSSSSTSIPSSWGPTPGVGAFANASRKPVPGRPPASTVTSPSGSHMSLPTSAPAHYVRDQSHIPWHQRKYEIYQPPAIGARAPPRYVNYHLLSEHARERLKRTVAQGLGPGRAPLLSTGSMFSGVGSGMGIGSVRSSLSMRSRPSMLGALSPTNGSGGSAGIAGLETITASPASTAAPLNSPLLDPTNALNAGPAASHRLSTILKRPPASPHTFSQFLPADATDLMDGTDPTGSMWHHSSPYDVGETVVSRGFGRGKDSGSPDQATPRGRPDLLSPVPTSSSGLKKGPSPLSQSASAINLTEPPLPPPPGSPDLLSGSRVKRKLSKRRSTDKGNSNGGRGGLSSLFSRKPSVDEGGLRNRSRPPLSPSSLSLAQSQSQGITFPTGSTEALGAPKEKRARRRLSKRGRGRTGSTSSVASVDSAMDGRSLETPIHAQFSQLPDVLMGGREVEIVELPAAREEPPISTYQARQQSRPSSQQPTRPGSQQQQQQQPYQTRPPSQQQQAQAPPQSYARPPSQQQHNPLPEPPTSAPPTMLSSPTAPVYPSTHPPVTKPTRERKISAASISSFLSRVTSRDKDKDRDERHPPRAASAQETDRKVAPHMLLNHVGPGGKRNKGERGSMFGRLARKLSLIRRRSVDVVGGDGGGFGGDQKLDAALRPLGGRPSFQVERRGRERDMATAGRSSSAAPPLQRRATLDLASGSISQSHAQRFPRASPEPPQQAQAGYGQAQLYSSAAPGTEGTDEIFAPIDPKLRSSRLINAPFSPPPRIPDLVLTTDRSSWASLHKHVTNARPPKSEVGAPEERPPHPSQSTPTLALAIRSAPGDEELVPPPPISDGTGSRHPDSPHSIPKWGIANGSAPRGPGLIMNGSPTDDSPLSLPRTMLTVANPDMVDSEGEDVRVRVRDSKLEAGEERRNRALPPNPPMSPPLKPAPVFAEPAPMPVGTGKRESVKPLDVKKSRTPSPVKQSGRESPVKPSGRESPAKKGGRESPTKKGGRERGREPRRERSPVKPVRRTEPLKDHSAMDGEVFSPQKSKMPLEALKNAEAINQGSPAATSLRTSMMAAGSTTSVDAIHGDDDAEFGAKHSDGADKGSKGRVLRHSRASMDSIGKMHVITPKTSLQKIRVRVVSNPPPVEIAKESSPVKEDAPKLYPSTDSADSTAPAPPSTAFDSRPSSVTEPTHRPNRSKSRPRSGYTGGESRHSIYDTATSVSSDDYGEGMNSQRSSVVGPRPLMNTVQSERPLSPPVVPTYSNYATPQMQSKVVESSPTTPYMTPTNEQGPLHPFSEKPVEYRNLFPSIAPISVMRVETAMPPFQKGESWSKAQMSPEQLKGALGDSSLDLAPPKAPFMNEAFSVSKEKLAAHAEFKKASGQRRDSITESERDRRRARDEREAELRKEREAKERALVEWEQQELARQRERAERDRLERERLEREQQERDRAERERIERERAERAERAERDRAERQRQEKARARAEQERQERERIEKERAEQERAERERLERERERAEKERLERERQERLRAIQRQKELEREQERERERVKDRERQARERDRERVEKERLERERQELERERIERERAERMRAEWERMERERIAEEEMRQREREQAQAQAQAQSQPPPLMHSNRSNSGGSRRIPRHGVDGEREVHVVTMKDMRKSSKHGRTPTHSRSASPTSTAPLPPPKDDRPFKSRQRSRTDSAFPSIASASAPPSQPAIEILGGVPVLPQGTHIEVAEAYPHRPSSENASDVSTLKAREAWERERLDKGQSVLGPGVQRAVIPDPSPPRPTPDPRQRGTTPKVPIYPNASTNVVVPEYGSAHTSYAQPSYPSAPPSRSHNPLPKPPTIDMIDGPYPLHRPGQPYSNPNRQQRHGRTASRNPLPIPPRVSPFPIHHNVSPPRGMPPGAVDSRAPGRWETMPS